MTHRLLRRLLGAVTAVAAASTVSALPPNFVSEPVASNWNQAVGALFAEDGRMFVWEKAGRVWLVENGVKSAQPLIDISEEVGDWRDFGLLGFAIDPDFYTNGYIYLLYVVDYHHLAFFGTPSYNPATNTYFRDTIGRLTRYQANAADGFRSVNSASRTILVGESITTGFPICHQSHGIGALAFGEDGSLLASCGDGASYETVDDGGDISGSSNTALDEGIIRPKEDVGAFRSQLVDSLSGKVIRINPANGNGYASNPYYDASAPRSAKSRVWSLGLRNPSRFTIRPGTGSPNPSGGDPGTLYIGDVGWNAWEELNIATGPGQNFGWPIYEGMNTLGGYAGLSIMNQDAPNPLFGNGQCFQQFVFFRQLIVQDTLATPSFPNPCNAAVQLPGTLNLFEHKRPSVDWGRPNGPARVPTYTGNAASVANVGAAGSPTAGPQFGGNCSIGGAWYTGKDFPEEFRNSYYHAEFGSRWIQQFIVGENDAVTEIRSFHEAAGAVVAVATDPLNGALYYIDYNSQGQSQVRRIYWTQNEPPIVAAASNIQYGPTPLTVQFSSAGTSDPDGQPLTYDWNFGDGLAHSGLANPTYTFRDIEDITHLGAFTAKIFSLTPPTPTGGGNLNPEVMRDGVYPPVDSDDSQQQYDTFHNNQQGNEDWVGYTFSTTRQLVGMIFQEGIHFGDGGWFDQLRVQRRTGTNTWTDVSGLSITPIYAANNGVNYETYNISFTPVNANGLRIYGLPGGSNNFISVGELRVFAASSPPNTGPVQRDVTLTVTDTLGGSGSASLTISLNNTPPQVEITSPLDGSTYTPGDQDLIIPLTATVTDAEHSGADLTCAWQTILHHDEHTHPEPIDSACSTQSVITPLGCHGPTYFYEFVLTVTDAHGLATTRRSFLYPDCVNCPGDTNGDAAVDFADLNNILGSYGQTGQHLPADLDGDGSVGFADLNIVLSNYGSNC